MTYRVEFESALAQLNGLASVVFDALVDPVLTLVEPWDAGLMAPGDDSAYRQAIFIGSLF